MVAAGPGGRTLMVGLMSSTVLTLIVLPTYYTPFDELATWLRRVWQSSAPVKTEPAESAVFWGLRPGALRGIMVVRSRVSMKALEFESRLANKDEIRVPPEVAEQIPDGSAVRVILLFDSGEDESWRQMSLERFAGAYHAEDAVYEALIHGPASR